jgi:trehalose 6-phosphate phosphatase
VSADLASLARRASEAGIFLDYDGCLAPIVSDPTEARAVRGAGATLARLARRFAVVAVISGRSLADLRARVRAPGVRLTGLHGLEGASAPRLPDGVRESVARAHERLVAGLRGVRGAVLEHKGLALAVHFRRAADPAGAEAVAGPIVRRVAEGEGLAVVPGRRILEVRPALGAADKGEALRRIAREAGLRAAFVAGDDVGDLPAFAAAGELEQSVRVAVASAEAPPALVEAADVVVGSPQELLALLRRLAAS